MQSKSPEDLEGGEDESRGFLATDKLDTSLFLKAPKQKIVKCSIVKVLGLFMAGFVFAILYLLTSSVWTHYGRFFLVSPFYTVYLVILYTVAALTLLSYVQTMLTEPGRVPMEWHSKVANSEKLSSKYRKCRKTNLYKPPRSSYDALTGTIVLNMDHYCPWVVNCVGFFNRKFFILFVFYACIGSFLTAFLLLPFGGKMFGFDMPWLSPPGLDGDDQGRHLKALVEHHRRRAKEDTSSLMAFVFSGTFSFALIFFVVAHVYMSMVNLTSMQSKSSCKKYDLGRRKNLEQVFGANPWFWLLPLYGEGPVGDGVHWLRNDGLWDGLESEAWELEQSQEVELTDLN